MLQQTQVKTVIAYFERFVSTFPCIDSLARASEDEVLALWSGLGYYSRARHLHQTARLIADRFAGQLPPDLTLLSSLPGIGRSTAAAICSLAYQQPTAILEGNVKRILARYFLIPGPAQQAATQKKLWQYAEHCMPPTRCAEYTQAIMDLGALICTANNPQCARCPVQTTCLAYQQQQVHVYPQKKIKKKLPEHHQQFFVLYTPEQQIYLEKRPSSGIWGGLWCLPTQLDDYPTLRPTRTWGITQITHTFSHFKLHIDAQACQISLPDALAHKHHAPGLWLGQHELLAYGLAKPVRTIIQQFFQRYDQHAAAPQAHPADPRWQPA